MLSALKSNSSIKSDIWNEIINPLSNNLFNKYNIDNKKTVTTNYNITDTVFDSFLDEIADSSNSKNDVIRDDSKNNNKENLEAFKQMDPLKLRPIVTKPVK